MRWVWILYLVTWAVSLELNRPGVLIEGPHKVQIARHVLSLKLEFQSLPEVLEQLVILKPRIAQIWKEISTVLRKQMQDPEIHQIYKDLARSQQMLWLWKLEQAEATVSNIIANIPLDPEPSEVSPNNTSVERNKRGLLNVVGNVASYLFGTATQDQIDQLETKLSVVSDTQQHELAIIQANSHLLKLHQEKLNSIVVTVNSVLDTTNALIEGVTKLSNALAMGTWVDGIYTEITFYANLFDNLLSSMQMLAHQIVTPTLLPYSELLRIVNIGINEFHLISALSEDHLANYYSLLSVSFHEGAVFIHIPFVELRTLNLYHYYPFPSFHLDEAMVLDITFDIALFAEDLSIMVEMKMSELQGCKSTSQSLVCLPSALFLKSFDSSACSWLLVKENQSYTSCSYSISTDSDVSRQALSSSTYLFFPETTALSYTCPPDSADGMTVKGRISVPFSCTASAKNFRMLGMESTNIPMRRLKLVKASPPDPLGLMSLKVKTIQNLTRLEELTPEEMVPIFLNGHVHSGVTLMTGLVSVTLLMVFVAFMCKYMRKRYAARAQGNKGSDNTERDSTEPSSRTPAVGSVVNIELQEATTSAVTVEPPRRKPRSVPVSRE